jgi:hypothetical protein
MKRYRLGSQELLPALGVILDLLGPLVPMSDPAFLNLERSTIPTLTEIPLIVFGLTQVLLGPFVVCGDEIAILTDVFARSAVVPPIDER